jgi:hypothetical protein
MTEVLRLHAIGNTPDDPEESPGGVPFQPTSTYSAGTCGAD